MGTSVWGCGVGACEFTTYFEYSDAAANNNVITDILHNAGGLTRNKGQQHWSFVQVPEEEQFTPGCSRAANMTKQIGGWIPEDSLEAQHHLEFPTNKDQ